METKHKILLQYGAAGTFIGYFVLHPLVMLFSHLMIGPASAMAADNPAVIHILLQSFSPAMLPWSLSFALFNGIIGLYYGMIKVEKLAREKVIAELQAALADVKTLSGLLPICAWCKNVRDDEGYWQQIEAYLKSRSDLDFTHGICNACAQKEYPRLYSSLKEKLPHSAGPRKTNGEP